MEEQLVLDTLHLYKVNLHMGWTGITNGQCLEFMILILPVEYWTAELLVRSFSSNFQDKIFFYGSVNTDAKKLDTVDVFDIANNEWQEGSESD